MIDQLTSGLSTPWLLVPIGGTLVAFVWYASIFFRLQQKKYRADPTVRVRDMFDTDQFTPEAQPLAGQLPLAMVAVAAGMTAIGIVHMMAGGVQP